MFAKPQEQHEWLHQLVGNWKFFHHCNMGPDKPASITEGSIAATSLGGLWVLLDCSGKMADAPDWRSQFHLGFDPAKDRFVGGFIASMMPQLWIYEGDWDSSHRVLTLDTEGPAFDGNGIAKYQDIFELVDVDHWLLRSQMLMPDGSWMQFLLGQHERILG